MKYLIIDERMRNIEKQTLKDLGYKLINLKHCNNVYEEISSHVDIFCTKIKNTLILEKNMYDYIKNDLSNNINIAVGLSINQPRYPKDISYNACVIGTTVIHNFKYTDPQILNYIKKENLNCINVKQGYTNCSIAVIDNDSIITSDIGLFNCLKKYNYNILFLDYPLNIKLLNNGTYSKMNGFIGGTLSRIGNNIFVSGDLNIIDKNNMIRHFINSRNLNIIDFPGLDIIDYGGIIEF